jgi:hypothetical protein
MEVATWTNPAKLWHAASGTTRGVRPRVNRWVFWASHTVAAGVVAVLVPIELHEDVSRFVPLRSRPLRGGPQPRSRSRVRLLDLSQERSAHSPGGRRPLSTPLPTRGPHGTRGARTPLKTTSAPRAASCHPGGRATGQPRRSPRAYLSSTDGASTSGAWRGSTWMPFQSSVSTGANLSSAPSGTLRIRAVFLYVISVDFRSDPDDQPQACIVLFKLAQRAVPSLP